MNIFKLVGTVFVDTEAANESLSKTDKSAEQTGKNLDAAFTGIKNGATKIVIGIGAMATAVGGAMLAVSAETREYRNEMAKLQTAFETSGLGATAATTTYKSLQGVLGETDQAVEASNHLAKLCNNEKELQTWTDICTGVYAEFGASLPIEGLTEAANETAKTGQLTGGLADALNWAGVSEDEFQAKLDACSTEQERNNLITQTMSGLYKDSAAAFRENNAEVISANEANENLRASMAGIGEAAEPFVATATQLASEFVENVTPAIEDFCEYTAEKIPEVVDWFDKNKGVVALLAGAVGTLTIAYGLYNAVQAIKTAMAAAEVTSIGALVVAYGAQAAAMAGAMAPYLLIAAAITALIAVGVLLYKNWDKIKEKATELFNKLKDVFGKIKERVVEEIEGMKTAVVNKFNALKGNVVDKVEGIKESVVNKFNAIKEGIVDKIDTARDKVKGIIDKIKGFFDFKVSLPNIKLPHFDIQPAGWKIGDLLEGEVPKLGIKWYKKAMNHAMVLDKPTIFGASDGNLLGAGEAGREVVSGEAHLEKLMKTTVASENAELKEVLVQILSAILNMDGNMGTNLKDALANMALKVNRREFGRLVREAL